MDRLRDAVRRPTLHGLRGRVQRIAGAEDLLDGIDLLPDGQELDGRQPVARLGGQDGVVGRLAWHRVHVERGLPAAASAPYATAELNACPTGSTHLARVVRV